MPSAYTRKFFGILVPLRAAISASVPCSKLYMPRNGRLKPHIKIYIGKNAILIPSEIV